MHGPKISSADMPALISSLTVFRLGSVYPMHQLNTVAFTVPIMVEI